MPGAKMEPREWDEATKALINDAAEKAAEVTLTRTLTSLGVDMQNPLQVQRDMQFLRAMRETWASAKSKGILVALGLMVTGFFSFLWEAVKDSVKGLSN